MPLCFIAFSWFMYGGWEHAMSDIVRPHWPQRSALPVAADSLNPCLLPLTTSSCQLGCIVGHVFWFGQDVWPLELASGGKGWFDTPRLVRRLIDGPQATEPDS
jgi:hypothetical protein